jgi:hypothetical protein
MGCVEDSTVPSGQMDTLKTLVIRIKLSCDIDKERHAAELEKLERLLLAECGKPMKTRSLQLERSMIKNNLVYYATTISKAPPI